MRLICGVFILLLNILPREAGGADITYAKSAKIDEVANSHIKPDGPGAAVAVVSQGKVLHQRGYGLADVKAKRPINPDTLFDLASVSKQFTAMAVMMLAESGGMTFDDDVHKYLPELRTHRPNRPIRVADLLHHTSGLPDYMGEWEGTDAEFAVLTNLGVLNLIKNSKLDFPTGSKHDYSNTNYVLLAIIVERVAKKPFDRFLRERIFDPLGMKHTRINRGDSAKFDNLALGYKHTKVKGLVRAYEPTIITGDGNVFSSVIELALWEQGLRTNKLVSASMLKPAFTSGKLDDGTEHDYGFGWADDTVGNRRSFGHGGGWAGYSNYACRYLDDDTAIFVLSNDERFDSSALVDAVAKLHFRK